MPGKTTIIKTVPTSMINQAKTMGGLSSIGGTPGKQTIVIAAPKSGAGMTAAGTPTKIITTVPKLAGTSTAGGTQFIVVTTRPGGTATLSQSQISSKYHLHRLIQKARHSHKWQVSITCTVWEG